mgnify:CR=1 FL=1
MPIFMVTRASNARAQEVLSPCLLFYCGLFLRYLLDSVQWDKAVAFGYGSSLPH